MAKFTNFGLVFMFMTSLMLMGMAGLPFILFEEFNPSPHLVAALRLTFVGILALLVGIVTSLKKPQKEKSTRTDIKDWATFVALAVLGVNCTLTYALYLLDDRLAMAVMLHAMGVVFIWHHTKSGYAWLATTFAIVGVFLLAVYTPDEEKFNLLGISLAVVGGTAQGIMFFKEELIPKNIDPGIALGTGFLFGGLSMIGVAMIITPLTQLPADMPILLIGTFLSALMTVLGWLILVYWEHKMSGSQKVSAASFEPVGAAITQFFKNGFPVPGEVIGIAFLVASAYMAIFVNKRHEKNDANRHVR